MRIHSDSLREVDIFRALREGYAPGSRDVHFHELEPKGSRSRDHAFEVKLAGLGDRHRRMNMSRTAMAATYADWGVFLTALFDLDPKAKAGPYDGREDFHVQTRHQFDVLRKVS